MAKAQIGDRHGEQAENKDQRAIGERQILGKELSAGAGQTHRRHQAGDEDQRCQQEAARPAEGMLHVSVEDCRAVSGLVHEGGAIRAQTEQRQIQQGQTDACHQARPDGVAGQQTRFADAAGACGIDNHDPEHHRAEGVHGQVAVDEAIGEWRGTIRFHRVADRARRPDNRGDRQHNQGDNFQRRKEISHRIQQFARIE